MHFHRFLIPALLAILPCANAVDLEPIIVSGFEPFGGRDINASYQTAKAIAEANDQVDLTLLEVPVVWGAPEKVLAEQNDRPWQVWLAFGEGKNGAFWIETVADNQRGKGLDNNKQPPAKPLILDDADEQLVSNFPVDNLIAELRRRGVPAKSSTEAGNYLCEEMLFNLLHARGANPKRIVLFIHTPVMGGKVILPDGTETKMGPEVMKLLGENILSAIAEVLK